MSSDAAWRRTHGRESDGVHRKEHDQEYGERYEKQLKGVRSYPVWNFTSVYNGTLVPDVLINCTL